MRNVILTVCTVAVLGGCSDGELERELVTPTAADVCTTEQLELYREAAILATNAIDTDARDMVQAQLDLFDFAQTAAFSPQPRGGEIADNLRIVAQAMKDFRVASEGLFEDGQEAVDLIGEAKQTC